MIVGNDFQFCHHFPREGLAITTVPVSLNHCYTRQARLEYGDTVMPILSYLLQLLIFTHASRPPPQTAGLLSSSYIRNLWLPHSSRIGAFFSWESLLGSWLCWVPVNRKSQKARNLVVSVEQVVGALCWQRTAALIQEEVDYCQTYWPFDSSEDCEWIEISELSRDYYIEKRWSTYIVQLWCMYIAPCSV